MHLLLAIRAFFAVLFGRTLPQELLPAATATAAPAAEPAAPAAPAAPIAAAAAVGPAPEAVAVRTLALLQSEGRLLDFVHEDISAYPDADVGAAVREIHRGLKKAIADHFTVEPVRSEAEESALTVAEGFDPAEIRLVGKVVGKPPFSGTLKHKGWRATAVRLPQVGSGKGALVIAPAEVEL